MFKFMLKNMNNNHTSRLSKLPKVYGKVDFQFHKIIDNREVDLFIFHKSHFPEPRNFFWRLSLEALLKVDIAFSSFFLFFRLISRHSASINSRFGAHHVCELTTFGGFYLFSDDG